MRPYVVRAGDYLARIANELSFDASTVWNDSANDRLRARRPNPQQLAPGDVLMVPNAARAAQPISAGGTHRFAGTVPQVLVSLELHRGGRAYASERYVVDGLPGTPQTGTTSAMGKVVISVPMGTTEVLIVLPARRVTIRARVGFLQPPTETRGIAQRLLHLGHLGYAAPVRSHHRGRAMSVEHAVRKFQHSEGNLPVTGHVDDATRAALVRRHGS